MWKTTLAQSGWNLTAGPCGRAKKGTGVGAIARDPLKLIPWATQNAKYNAAYKLGRCAIYTLELGCTFLTCINVYGWTGGHDNLAAAQATDDLVDICIQEIGDRHHGPVCLQGDINADTADIPSISNLLDEQGWVDCGAVASWWGGQDAVGTCQAPNTSRTTRRDYMFVNQHLLPSVRTFRVEQEDRFPTHQPTYLEIEVSTLEQTTDRLRKTTSAALLFAERLEEEIKTKKEDEHEGTVRKRVLGNLHTHIDEALNLREARLKHAQLTKDTTVMWSLIVAAMEEGFIDFFRLKGTEAKAMKGRADVRITKVTKKPGAIQGNGKATPARK